MNENQTEQPINVNEAVILHRVGDHAHSDFATRAQIEAIDKHTLLTFDGVYESVYKNRDLLKGRPVVFFVIGDGVGKSSTLFNPDLPDEKMCTWDQIIEMSTELDAAIGWHSKTHRDLTKIDQKEWYSEVKPPFPMALFAYPYGNFTPELQEYVGQFYADAWSVTQGSGGRFSRTRRYP